MFGAKYPPVMQTDNSGLGIWMHGDLARKMRNALNLYMGIRDLVFTEGSRRNRMDGGYGLRIYFNVLVYIRQLLCLTYCMYC